MPHNTEFSSQMAYMIPYMVKKKMKHNEMLFQ